MGQPPVEELFGTEEVYPQEKGEVQISFSSLFHRDSSRKTRHFPVSVEYGITETFQIEAQWEGYTNMAPFIGPSAHSVGNLTVGVKRSFMNMRKSVGVLDGDAHCYLKEVRGRHKNEDIVLA